nr:unnamed protein product [Spirometra erinaceieuropaei]
MTNGETAHCRLAETNIDRVIGARGLSVEVEDAASAFLSLSLWNGNLHGRTEQFDMVITDLRCGRPLSLKVTFDAPASLRTRGRDRRHQEDFDYRGLQEPYFHFIDWIPGKQGRPQPQRAGIINYNLAV